MKILALSAHPDDETLGCGGTLLRHAAHGDMLHWLIVTSAHQPQWPQSVIDAKAEEVSSVADAFGMMSVHKLGMPTTRLDTIPLAELINGVRSVVEQVRPDVVYLVHPGDVHTDHRITFDATLSVLKAFTMQRLGVGRILTFETLSSSEAAPFNAARAFGPTVYRNITPYIDRKIEIMSMYRTEAQPDPMPRGESAIRALARYRGASVGLEYAEGFMLIREID